MIPAQVRVLLTLGIAFVALGAAAYHEAGNSVFAEAASKPHVLPCPFVGRLQDALLPAHTLSTAEFDAAATIERWTEGMTLNLPLPDGTVRTGSIQLVQHEAGGSVRVGGSLPDDGSFSFGASHGRLGGLVQLPAECVAWQWKQQAGGGIAYV